MRFCEQIVKPAIQNITDLLAFRVRYPEIEPDPFELYHLKHPPIQQYGDSNRFDLKCLAEEGGELRHDGLHGREACSHTTPTQ